MAEGRNAVSVFIKAFQGLQSSFVKNGLQDIDRNAPVTHEKKSTKVYMAKQYITPEDYGRHLRGEQGIGVCPINGSNHCYFATVDIDSYDESGFDYILSIIHDYDLPLNVFKSKSGGIHIHIFFTEAESAKDVRSALYAFCSMFSLDRRFQDKNGQSRVEVFPKQDVLPKDGKGSCVTLPYFNYSDPVNPMLAPDGTEVTFQAAMQVIESSMTSIKHLRDKLSSVPYSDAPPCMQAALVSGLVGKDAGRNDFLFSCAVYLKKKSPDTLGPELQKMNRMLKSPLEEREVSVIADSVAKGEFRYKCKGAVCTSFCQKKLCASREYGVGRNKGHFTGIDFGLLIRMNSKDPYYVWELRVNDTDPYKAVVFKDEGELSDQKQFLIHCIRYLNCAPVQVAPNDWLDTVNTALSKMQIKEVSDDTDTTDLSLVHKAFVRYLVQKQADKAKAYMLRVGAVIKDGDDYCFSTEGINDYLNTSRVGAKGMLLRDVLLRFGCEEGVMAYKTSTGKVKNIKCWKKKADSEITLEQDLLGDVIEGDIESITSAVKEAAGSEVQDRDEDEEEINPNEIEF
jgi:hypothetical protein